MYPAIWDLGFTLCNLHFVFDSLRIAFKKIKIIFEKLFTSRKQNWIQKTCIRKYLTQWKIWSLCWKLKVFCLFFFLLFFCFVLFYFILLFFLQRLSLLMKGRLRPKFGIFFLMSNCSLTLSQTYKLPKDW